MQRLLLMNHARSCPAPVGTCKMTPLCGAMKQLVPHMTTCRNDTCGVRHCATSRSLWAHFSRCHGPCEVCSVVREALSRNISRVMLQLHLSMC